MKSKPTLELKDVEAIMRASVAEATKNSFPVTIAICDDGGHLLALLRLDGSASISVDIAVGKALTAALGRRESRLYEEMVNEGRTAFTTARSVTALEGGVLVVVSGHVVGAVGVSGAKSHEDAQVAKAGALAIS
ncbi:GlcG/HbpS family heme-binding protein [Pseudomonas typographi]|uniref:GlcG/HbpS family heme-binding protein n=1 Tax=Pseudomonas typographi TaxID=2715964 RepID=UPI001688EC3D|nr:heme-binding protein [Pseudomonas typographi]MBD1589342.1 hypothetical protein [Pseudomonas typographi]